MFSFVNRIWRSSQIGWESFQRSWGNPGNPALSSGDLSRTSLYDLYWAWYTNTAFDQLNQSKIFWDQYRKIYRLYCNTRSIYNPFTRLVDFYANQVYPGILTLDGSKLPDGIPSAIPFPDDTPETIKIAVAQLWRWWSWQSQKAVLVRYGSIAGSVMVEIIDEPFRNKLDVEVIWASRVKYVILDRGSNVKGYTLEYSSYDDDLREFYTYRKEVDQFEFRTFRNNEPYGYNGGPSSWPNTYGFVPAVWVKHIDVGGDYGRNCLRALGKIDELNSIVSHSHDQIHKKINSPGVFWTEGPISNITPKKVASRSTEWDASVASDTSNENLLLLKGQPGGRFESLAGMLQLQDAIPYIDRLMKEIEADHPELVMYSQLRDKSQLTGPGAARSMGDVAGSVTETATNYDLQSVKLFQMGLAIAGQNIKDGVWIGPTNSQQAKFTSFDLDSYLKGDLDFQISPRPLIPMTQLERIALEQAQKNLENPPASPADTGATHMPIGRPSAIIEKANNPASST
jgi:hypothetical protein